MSKIELTIGEITLRAQLLDTPTAQAIYAALPIQSVARTWGEEVYFTVPVNVDKETDAKDVVDAGELAFWVEGSCIAIGFGPTPISNGDEIRLAAKTNIWGKSLDDVKQLLHIKDGDAISVKAIP
ncbi:cyclophilin-like fold protein [Kaarinaea lacus]